MAKRKAVQVWYLLIDHEKRITSRAASFVKLSPDASVAHMKKQIKKGESVTLPDSMLIVWKCLKPKLRSTMNRGQLGKKLCDMNLNDKAVAKELGTGETIRSLGLSDREILLVGFLEESGESVCDCSVSQPERPLQLSLYPLNARGPNRLMSTMVYSNKLLRKIVSDGLKGEEVTGPLVVPGMSYMFRVPHAAIAQPSSSDLPRARPTVSFARMFPVSTNEILQKAVYTDEMPPLRPFGLSYRCINSFGYVPSSLL